MNRAGYNLLNEPQLMGLYGWRKSAGWGGQGRCKMRRVEPRGLVTTVWTHLLLGYDRAASGGANRNE